MISPAALRAAQRRRSPGRPYKLTPARVLFAAALARAAWIERSRGGRVCGPVMRAWASAMYEDSIATGDVRTLPDESWPVGWRREPLPDSVPPPSPVVACAFSQLATWDWRVPVSEGHRRTRKAALHDHSEDMDRGLTENGRRAREDGAP